MARTLALGARSRRSVAWLVASCLALAGGAWGGRSDTEPAVGEFTVATYNVLHENRDVTNLVATIRQLHADLVALQETNPQSEKFLRRELATEFSHMAFRGGEKASDGFGFLAKTPLRHLQFLDPLPGWRGCWITEVTLGGTNVQVASVHLATPRSPPLRSLAGLMTAAETVESLHAQEIVRIHQRLTRQGPVIVLGDFNSLSFFSAPRFLVERGFVDSLASVTTNAEEHGTWPYLPREPGLRFRIDFIFHTPNLRTLECHVLPSWASDHAPVVSRLQGAGGRACPNPVSP